MVIIDNDNPSHLRVRVSKPPLIEESLDHRDHILRLPVDHGDVSIH